MCGVGTTQYFAIRINKNAAKGLVGEKTRS